MSGHRLTNINFINNMLMGPVLASFKLLCLDALYNSKKVHIVDVCEVALETYQSLYTRPSCLYFAWLALLSLYIHRYSGFSDSDEAAVTEQLLDALNQGDENTATNTLSMPMFTYLDNDVSVSCSHIYRKTRCQLRCSLVNNRIPTIVIFLKK